MKILEYVFEILDYVYENFGLCFFKNIFLHKTDSLFFEAEAAYARLRHLRDTKRLRFMSSDYSQIRRVPPAN